MRAVDKACVRAEKKVGQKEHATESESVGEQYVADITVFDDADTCVGRYAEQYVTGKLGDAIIIYPIAALATLVLAERMKFKVHVKKIHADRECSEAGAYVYPISILAFDFEIPRGESLSLCKELTKSRISYPYKNANVRYDLLSETVQTNRKKAPATAFGCIEIMTDIDSGPDFLPMACYPVGDKKVGYCLIEGMFQKLSPADKAGSLLIKDAIKERPQGLYLNRIVLAFREMGAIDIYERQLPLVTPLPKYRNK